MNNQTEDPLFPVLVPRELDPVPRGDAMSLERAREIILGSRYGQIATCVDGQPRIRPMAFALLDDMRLWSSTYRVSGKVAEFEGNPKVEVCFVDKHKAHLRIEGRVDISGGREAKKKLFEIHGKIKRHFDDEDDPKLVHVEIVPTRIRWKVPGFNEYNEVPLP